MRAILVALYSLFFFADVFCQTLSRSIEWQQMSEKGSNFMWFANAEFRDANTMVPYYYELIPVSNDTKEVQVEISNQKWQPLSSIESNCIAMNNLDNTISNRVLIQNKKSFVALSVPTIRVVGDKDFEKLISFDIEIKGDKKRLKGITHNTKTTSVLNSGKWVKINVEKSGIYKITHKELIEWGLNDVECVSVWGNGGTTLPYMNNEPCPDDLNSIPIYIEKGSDGIFNNGDYILFYAEGPETFKFNQESNIWTTVQNTYSKTSSYFITSSQPQNIIVTAQEPLATYTHTTQSYDAVVVFENEDTNMVQSGRQWFGDIFDITTTRNYNTNLNNPVAGSELKILVQAAAKSHYNTNFTIKLNSTKVGQLNMSSVNGSSYSNVVSVHSKLITTTIPDNNIVLELNYNKTSIADIAWLDYIAVNARQQLKYQDKQLTFWDSKTIGTGHITQFTIQNGNSSTQVWDITNLNSTKRIPTSGNNNITFKQASDSLCRYIVFSANDAYTASFAGNVENQNIHGIGQPNMVIVSHPDYLTYANEIANIHRDMDNLTVEVFSTEQVYNEFSSGKADVGAIRNLMRMLYQRAKNESEQPKYLLLFGDGSYNNRSNASYNTNRIPTFQSENSINPTDSYVTDDFFGLLDYNEGGGTGLLDIGVGRIPASTTEHANAVLNKIKAYTSNSNISDWQNVLCFVGDDEDGNTHMIDANKLADYVRSNNPEYNVQKIFFDAYPQEVLSIGHSYPDVTEAINSRINNGTLIFNYTGHANERWLSHEKVIMLNDIMAWQNLNALPLFITATCEFSRFDDPNLISAGEQVLLSPNGGAVSLLSTTRVVYSSPNFTLNYNFIKNVFKRNTNNQHYTLGDLVKISKNSSGNGTNKLNFTLLGDPALKLRFPTYKAELLTINGNEIGEQSDTLKSLDRIKLTGRITDTEGFTITDFNGTAIIALYDKAIEITTLANDGGSPMTFTSQENILFKGNASVSEGLFSIEFIIPKDINFSYGKGKISMFATNNQISAMGAYSDVVIGGIGSNPQPDNMGPDIELFLNDERFTSGGICDPNPKLVVKLNDNSGINTTGIGIGHDFVATLTTPSGTTSTINLNSYYSSVTDNYQQGVATYQFSNLSLGKHILKVKAWDIYNNSSEAQITFMVTNGNKFLAKNLYCFPNPITNSTNFYFEHNQPNTIFDIDLEIYNLSGLLVRQMKISNTNSGNFKYGPIYWDGCGQQGAPLSRGVYLCRLVVKNPEGEKNSLQQKIIVIR